MKTLKKVKLNPLKRFQFCESDLSELINDT